MAPYYQFEASEQVRESYKIPDGDTKDSPPGYQREGLDDVHRSEGCILSGSDTSLVQALPSFSMAQSSLAVQGAVLRPMYSSMSFYEGHDPSGYLGSSARNQTTSILRRLANPCTGQAGAYQPDKLASFQGKGPRTPHQLGEVGSLPKEVHSLPGHAVRHCDGLGQTCHQESRQVSTTDPQFSSAVSPVSLGLAADIGTHDFFGEVGPVGQVPYEVLPVLSERRLDPVSRSCVFSSPDYSRSPSGSTVVVRPTQSRDGSVDFFPGDRHETLHGCLLPRVGSSPRGLSDIRFMVQPPEGLAHKSQGVGGSEIGTPGFSRLPERQDSNVNVGQCNSGSLHQVSGGDPFQIVVSRDSKAPRLDEEA